MIAGPILHYSDVMPQMRGRFDFDAKQFSQRLFLFATCLFKKSVIADRIAEKVDPLFAANTVLQFFESWVASLGYGLLIYFYFSGYSDMAIGIGLMFGIVLPHNFNSPYQAVSIADFCMRWHMTLSRFLRGYVYILLGGNRNGFARGGCWRCQAAYFTTLFFTSIGMSGSHESFIYWQFDSFWKTALVAGGIAAWSLPVWNVVVNPNQIFNAKYSIGDRYSLSTTNERFLKVAYLINEAKIISANSSNAIVGQINHESSGKQKSERQS